MKKTNAGFSLVELIIVIAIMAILIGVLAPQYVKYVEKSRKAKDEKFAGELLEMSNVLATDGEYAQDISEGDYIRFDINGITTNNSALQTKALPEFISGWTTVKVISSYYQNKYYEVVFTTNRDDSKMVIRNGWH